MRELIAISFDSPHKAEELRLKLLKMQEDYLVDLEDAVAAVVKPDGSVKLNQTHKIVAGSVVSGGFWGLLIGLIFMSPLLGAGIGAAAGLTAGALADVGIRDDFMKDLAKALTPGASVLFALVRDPNIDRVVAELKGHGGKVLHTSLSHEDEATLQRALDEIRESAPAQSQ